MNLKFHFIQFPMKTKTIFHKSILTSVVIIIMLSLSCKKDSLEINDPDTYSSVADFLAKNSTPFQTYTIDAATGDSITTSNGTILEIMPYSFMTQSGSPVIGNVTITYKEIYKRSEMLLNDISTNMLYGGPIKSGGMFYIKAVQGSQVLLIKPGKEITFTMPFQGWPLDTNMVALMLVETDIDTAGWMNPPSDTLGPYSSLYYTAADYIYSLYQFNPPLDSGTWANCDNPGYFSAYSQTTLTLHPLDNYTDYHMDLFLIFNDVNSMVHVYWYGTDFPYSYAPVGLQCTAVAIGVKDGKLYSSFTPLTVSSNLTVNFSLAETTTEAFMSQLEALD